LWNDKIPSAEPPDIFVVNQIAADLTPPAPNQRELGLGFGLVAMPEVSPLDRLAQIKHDLRLPLAKRACSNPTCQDPHAEVEPATRKRPRAKLYYQWTGDDSQLPPDCHLEMLDGVEYVVPERGYCRYCCTPFDLRPLAAGTAIGPILVDGPFACGGDSFIHHATHNITAQELVLKTPHNAHDPDGARRIQEEANELKAWQEVSGAFRLIGLLQHEGRPVMVLARQDGMSLTDIRLRHKRPLPPEVGLAYLIAVMQIVHAGHKLGRWHLDIQPKNVIIGPPGDRLSLGDFGAGQSALAKRADHGFTPGFSAPEMDPERGKPSPSAAVDVYGFGRLFAFLCLHMNMLGRYKYDLPTPADEPLFASFESIYRFVRQLTALNPRRRMDLAPAIEQAKALLLEIIALKENRRLPVQCPVFLPDTARVLADDFLTLPRLRVDVDDVAASVVASVSYGSDLAEQQARLEQIMKQHPHSGAVRLLLASLLIDNRRWENAEQLLLKFSEADPFSLPCLYERARLAMGRGDLERVRGDLKRAHDELGRAQLYFEACYSGWPGTVGIKLALARVEELLGNRERATRLYETAARVDGTRVTGAFGLARLAEEAEDWSQAIQAYGLVPRTSWAFARATSGMANAWLRRLSTTGDFQLGELEQLAELAGTVLDQPDLVLEVHMLKAEIYKLALKGLRNGLAKNKSTTILGTRLVNRQLRWAAADALREASRHVQDQNKRCALISEARRIQPISVFGRG
jgi:serine/threonine-protein kinase PknG